MARPRKNPPTIDKICPTCKNTFTISSRKYRQIFCSRSCKNHDQKILEKMKSNQTKTFNEKYGGHPMTTKHTIDNFKKSLFKNHGEDYYTNYLVKKSKETNLKNHGNENYNNIEKIKQTCLEKYGVDNVWKSKVVLENRSQTVKDNHYEYLLNLCKSENIEFLCSKENYDGYHFTKKYQFKCLKCGYIFENSVYHLINLFCEKCDPNRKNTLENQIFDFLISILPNGTIIKRHDRTILVGKELDFYIPSKNIAIELNGLFWHSETGGGINKWYHLNKSKNCIFHGIRLIHIFENEWIKKQEIVKSVLKNVFEVTSERIFARNCEIKELDIKVKDKFLDENHLQGKDKSTIKLGLFNNNELVSAMSFRKTSRFDKTVDWELMRYCNKLNTNIVGGASKLFSHFMNTIRPHSIVSYSDRRYFDGNLYQQLGFSFVKSSSPGYYYIGDKYKSITHRMTFQKHKLKKLLPVFNENLSEWENMKNNGFDRIWDCGNDKWILKTK